jgi:hypothetical protein
LLRVGVILVKIPREKPAGDVLLAGFLATTPFAHVVASVARQSAKHKAFRAV